MDMFDLRNIGRVFIASVTMLSMVFIAFSAIRSIEITRYQSLVALVEKGYSPEEARCALAVFFRDSEECSALGGVSELKKTMVTLSPNTKIIAATPPTPKTAPPVTPPAH